MTVKKETETALPGGEVGPEDAAIFEKAALPMDDTKLHWQSYHLRSLYMVRTRLWVAPVGVMVVGCGRPMENRTGTDWTSGEYNVNEVPLNESSGDAMSGAEFLCAGSSFSLEAGFCAVDGETCKRVIAQIVVRGANEPTECRSTNAATCYVTTTHRKDRFVCGPTERTCKYQREKERARNAYDSIGECVEQHSK